jgi:hypothetical protein
MNTLQHYSRNTLAFAATLALFAAAGCHKKSKDVLPPPQPPPPPRPPPPPPHPPPPPPPPPRPSFEY